MVWLSGGLWSLWCSAVHLPVAMPLSPSSRKGCLPQVKGGELLPLEPTLQTAPHCLQEPSRELLSGRSVPHDQRLLGHCHCSRRVLHCQASPAASLLAVAHELMCEQWGSGSLPPAQPGIVWLSTAAQPRRRCPSLPPRNPRHPPLHTQRTLHHTHPCSRVIYAATGAGPRPAAEEDGQHAHQDWGPCSLDCGAGEQHDGLLALSLDSCSPMLCFCCCCCCSVLTWRQPKVMGDPTCRAEPSLLASTFSCRRSACCRSRAPASTSREQVTRMRPCEQQHRFSDCHLPTGPLQ